MVAYIVRWPDPARCHYHIILLGHSPCGLDDFVFIVGYHFDSMTVDQSLLGVSQSNDSPLQLYSKIEAHLCKEVGVAIFRLSVQDLIADDQAVDRISRQWERYQRCLPCSRLHVAVVGTRGDGCPLELPRWRCRTGCIGAAHPRELRSGNMRRYTSQAEIDQLRCGL